MKKNKKMTYKGMFLEDIHRDIEYLIVKHDFQERYKNVNIVSENDQFEEYLKYNRYNYIEHDFLHEVSNLICNTIEKGHGEAIISKYKNNNNVVKGFEIIVPVYNLRIRGLKYTYFIQKYFVTTNNKKYNITKIKNDEIIFLSRKKLNISNKKMKKILKKLASEKILDNLFELTQKNLLLQEEFNQKIDKKNVGLYKKTKEIRWDARKVDTNILTLPYIYYRKVAYYKFLINALEKTIEAINRRILNQNDLKYKGKIVVETKDVNELNEALNRIMKGTAKQEDYLF